MVVRIKYEDATFDEAGEQTEIKDVERKMVDAEIDQNMGGVCGLCVERLADGGLKFINRDEDEFGIESFTEVILTKSDLDKIKELEATGLL